MRLPRASLGQRIALFGGSFNPPHKGHRHVALTGLNRLGVSQVWWMVTPGNPLKSSDDLPPLQHRIAQTETFADHPRMLVTAFEASLGTRYTADAVTILKRRFPYVKFVWLMGADNLATLHRWQKWRDIMRQVPVAVVDRPGASMSVMSSPAARAFASARRPEEQAGALADAAAPAWVFLHVPLDPTSSTLLRSKVSRPSSS
ncbi:MAG: nicotinate-nucleotide adenylyltransferase [Devosia sp.]